MSEIPSPTRPLSPAPAMKKMDTQDRVMRLLVTMVALVLVVSVAGTIVNFLQYQLLFRTFNGATSGSNNFVAGTLDSGGILPQNQFKLVASSCTGSTLANGKSCTGYTVTQKYGDLQGSDVPTQLIMDAARKRLYVVATGPADGQFSLGYFSTSETAPKVKWLANLGDPSHSQLSLNTADGNLYFTSVDTDDTILVNKVVISGDNASLTGQVTKLADTSEKQVQAANPVATDDQGNVYWMAANYDVYKYTSAGQKSVISNLRSVSTSKLKFNRVLYSDGKSLYAPAFDPTSNADQDKLVRSVYKFDLSTSALSRVGTTDIGNAGAKVASSGTTVGMMTPAGEPQQLTVIYQKNFAYVRFDTRSWLPTLPSDIALNGAAGVFVVGTHATTYANVLYYFDNQGRSNKIVGVGEAALASIAGDAATGSFYYIEQGNGVSIGRIKLR